MKEKDLITLWGAPEPPRLAPKQFSIRLPMLVAAKISALCEMYPRKTKTEIIGDLLTSSLERLEQDFPPEKAPWTSSECDDHIFEDVGIGATFRSLTEKHLREIEKDAGVTDPMPYHTKVVFSDKYDI